MISKSDRSWHLNRIGLDLEIGQIFTSTSDRSSPLHQIDRDLQIGIDHLQFRHIVIPKPDKSWPLNRTDHDPYIGQILISKSDRSLSRNGTDRDLQIGQIVIPKSDRSYPLNETDLGLSFSGNHRPSTNQNSIRKRLPVTDTPPIDIVPRKKIYRIFFTSPVVRLEARLCGTMWFYLTSYDVTLHDMIWLYGR